MCGRYNLISDAGALVDFFRTVNRLDTQPRYNIAPSQDVPVVRAGKSGRELVLMHWGLVPHWARDRKIAYHTINARAETVASKPAFRDAFRRHRCLVPATGFYEWKADKKGKQPYNIRVGDGKLFAFAGLWAHWTRHPEAPLDSFSIIVTDANEAVRPVHERMPVILHPDDYETWLDPTIRDPARLQPLLRPCPASWVNSYPVGRLVNTPANDEPECLEPVKPAH